MSIFASMGALWISGSPTHSLHPTTAGLITRSPGLRAQESFLNQTVSFDLSRMAEISDGQKHALITHTSIVQLMIRMILTMLIGSYAGIAISVMSFSAFMA